jgi:hypothetical protein
MIHLLAVSISRKSRWTYTNTCTERCVTSGRSGAYTVRTNLTRRAADPSAEWCVTGWRGGAPTIGAGLTGGALDEDVSNVIKL